MKNIKLCIFIILTIFFISCESTKVESFDFNNEDISSDYTIKTHFKIPEELLGVWKCKSSEGSAYNKIVAFYKDNTFLMYDQRKADFYVGVYYTCIVDDTEYIQFNLKYHVYKNINTFNSIYYIDEYKNMIFDSRYKILINTDNTSFSLSDYFYTVNSWLYRFEPSDKFVKVNENPYFPSNFVENEYSNVTLKDLRENAKKDFINSYKHPNYAYRQLFKENSYELDGLTITVHKETPKNWPSNIKKIKKYTFRHSMAREVTGEVYPKDTAYQITIPNTVIQWIDKNNCLLVFHRDYESASSDVYWCHTDDLGDVYNKKNLWFSTTPDEGLQLFFEYLGSKEYTTQNGFSKKVPELKLFYADKDSLGDKKITIDDLYFFFEDLNLAQ